MDKEEILDSIFENDPLGLLNVKPKKSTVRTSDERLATSFDEINDFIEKHDREPKPDPTNISEYQLYSRLKSLREDNDKIAALESQDIHGLLNSVKKEINSLDDIFSDDDSGLLGDDGTGLFTFEHTPRDYQKADQIGSRTPCEDFEEFEPMFIQCQDDLREGRRELLSFSNDSSIKPRCFYVQSGVLAYVAEMSEREIREERNRDRIDYRLRLIYENGTESDILRNTLAKRLRETGKRVTENREKVNKSFVENFTGVTEEDESSGYIYVLKSKSEDENVSSISDLYKIGYSTSDVEERIKNAEKEPTYLMAPVSIQGVWQCYNMNPQKFEQLIHNFFGNSCLEVDVFDADGKRYTPREWFIVPMGIIEQVIGLIINGDIIKYRYDSDSMSIVNK